MNLQECQRQHTLYITLRYLTVDLQTLHDDLGEVLDLA